MTAALPATFRSVGATVNVRPQWNQPVLFLAGSQQRTGDRQKTDAVRPAVPFSV